MDNKNIPQTELSPEQASDALSQALRRAIVAQSIEVQLRPIALLPLSVKPVAERAVQLALTGGNDLALLCAIGRGIYACAEQSFTGVWSAYATARSSVGETSQIPAGRMDVTCSQPRWAAQPDYAAIAKNVFGCLALFQRSALESADAHMRGALRARVRELDAKVVTYSVRADAAHQVAGWRHTAAQLRVELDRVSMRGDQ